MALRPCFLALFSLLFLSVAVYAQEEPTPTPPSGDNNRIWTVDEILAEDKEAAPRQPIEYCQKGRFAPCVCWYDVAREMRYRPAVRECGGDAAVVLGGKYLGVFSVVVRDSENRDRWPASNFGGCSAFERDILALNKCSAFKVQKKIRVSDGKRNFIVHCLGASGYSGLFKKVVRVTAKLADVPNSTNDPLVRWCLRRPSQPLN